MTSEFDLSSIEFVKNNYNIDIKINNIMILNIMLQFHHMIG